MLVKLLTFLAFAILSVNSLADHPDARRARSAKDQFDSFLAGNAELGPDEHLLISFRKSVPVRKLEIMVKQSMIEPIGIYICSPHGIGAIFLSSKRSMKEQVADLNVVRDFKLNAERLASAGFEDFSKNDIKSCGIEIVVSKKNLSDLLSTLPEAAIAIEKMKSRRRVFPINYLTFHE